MARRKRKVKIVGKAKADGYSWSLRKTRIKFTRRKVGTRTWEFTY